MPCEGSRVQILRDVYLFSQFLSNFFVKRFSANQFLLAEIAAGGGLVKPTEEAYGGYGNVIPVWLGT